jgi:flagellar hook-basal body complex protein FliE
VKAMNAIQPIIPINSLEELNAARAVTPTIAADTNSATAPFRSLFQNAISGVQKTDADLGNQIYQMASGQSDNLHNVLIASQKAGLSVDMVVELRNKLLDAYKELININV